MASSSPEVMTATHPQPRRGPNRRVAVRLASPSAESASAKADPACSMAASKASRACAHAQQAARSCSARTAKRRSHPRRWSG